MKTTEIGRLRPGDVFSISRRVTHATDLLLLIAIDDAGCSYIDGGSVRSYWFGIVGHISQYDYSATTVLVLKSV